MHQRTRGFDEPRDVLLAENERQPSLFPWKWDVLQHVRALQRLHVYESERCYMLTNCLGSEFAVTEQMCLVSANVVGSELLDRLTTVPGKVINDPQVILDRNFGVIT